MSSIIQIWYFLYVLYILCCLTFGGLVVVIPWGDPAALSVTEDGKGLEALSEAEYGDEARSERGLAEWTSPSVRNGLRGAQQGSPAHCNNKKSTFKYIKYINI